ncbi:Sensory box histidine kinase [Pseudomonas chlororaphis subsp. aureofaciens]|uniref:histidine kinase n=1 Tax=Pseudomonas chlororaphis subsp. aureofaciens TaxID=587851 RepID=A0AAD0ZHK0_9PSED|nr:PAS domain S-box protein [Pseudomonas chlororaphis]AZD98084.1 Sensory box histidine kinase [Pseudomonas chlororaphis subsp. aureofaciens]AZE16522.1 Sensory box histidine kinase [Pseudomonas chlororaphis subsp. aureofaciens]AZE28930.1 Sensory box histidine kinase [Pseudomonas chlororaphis subsp. aureofaciens]AZE35181.1 Sensory box histidine kinase [Pseudomonas chlororaphis subsp. aureofaciens]AZE41589.1 Sensory box histidine kinase [Pseudomonas chlororaphis subsp. aureofaciens]
MPTSTHLSRWLHLQREGRLPDSPWLGHDPQPSLLLDAEARPVDLNPALLQWLDAEASSEVAALLPINHPALVRACLEQQRAIEEVEAQWGDRVLLWSFIPDPHRQRVLARCREATAQILAERESATARRLYRLITENTTDLISRHTPDGTFLDASPASWTLLGYWPEELRGRLARSLFHSQDLAGLTQRTRDALEQDGYHTMTFRIRHRDGHYLWFETACRAIRETYTGAVVEVVAVSRDITSRVQAEENKRRLAEVVEANPDPVLFIQPGGAVTYLNPAARRTLGLEAGQPMPDLASILTQEVLGSLQREGWHRAEHSGRWSIEARLQPPAGGASVPVSLMLLAHRAASGERFYSLVAHDQSERELREAQQRHHQDELAHTARLVTLGELASGIAHEINQPLAAVVNYANASQRYLQALDTQPQAVQKVAQGLERIAEQATHAAEVIKRLRAFLRKGGRRVQALDLAEVARETVRLCAWEAQACQVTIELRLADNLPPVYADRILLEQVLLNLLRNAIEANREVHPQQGSQIVLGAQASGEGGVEVSVSDQGPGVSAEQLAQLFTPFYTSKANGLGLGLSMSRSIVEGFGGDLQAQPQSRGLKMCCHLPATAPAQADSPTHPTTGARQ